MARDPEDVDYRRLLHFRTEVRRFVHWSEEQALAVGVAPAQHQLMLAIRGHDHPNGPSIGEVADALVLRHSSAVGLIDRAADAGLVTRHTDDRDSRVIRLRLTARGRRLIRDLSRAHLEQMQHVARRLTLVLSALTDVAHERVGGVPREPVSHGADRLTAADRSDHIKYATGMIADQARCDVAEALSRLEIRAAATGQTVEHLALDVLDGVVRFRE